MKKKKINSKKISTKKAKSSATLTKSKFKLPLLDKNKKTVLLLTIGDKQTSSKLPKAFTGKEWQSISINPVIAGEADIVSPIYELSLIENESIDAVYCSRGPERLFFYQAQKMFAECARILKENGQIVVQTGNMEMISEIIYNKGLSFVINKAAAAEITAMDLVYGYGKWIKDGKEHAQHLCAFTPPLLAGSFKTHGFHNTTIDATGLNMIAKSYKIKKGDEINNQPLIRRPDINIMMQERDELRVEPTIKVNYTSKTK